MWTPQPNAKTDIFILKKSIYHIYQNLAPFRKPLLGDVIFDTQIPIIQTCFPFLKNIQKVKNTHQNLIYFSNWFAHYILKPSIAALLLHV